MSGHRHPQDWHRCPACGAEHKKQHRERGVLRPGELGFETNAANPELVRLNAWNWAKNTTA